MTVRQVHCGVVFAVEYPVAEYSVAHHGAAEVGLCDHFLFYRMEALNYVFNLPEQRLLMVQFQALLQGFQASNSVIHTYIPLHL